MTSLCEYAIQILLTKDADEKSRLTSWVVSQWQAGAISLVLPPVEAGTVEASTVEASTVEASTVEADAVEGNGVAIDKVVDTLTGEQRGRRVEAPNQPGRPESVKILAAGKMPKRGAGTLANRIALLHSLVHIENSAIDLTWDIIVRFTRYNMPKAYYDNFVKIAGDEAKHYTLLNNRLKELGSYYGELPAHEGLWESAQETAHDLYARLAIEHMVHEARGLDVTPKTIEKFRSGGDSQTADLLELILQDEITHVTAGQTWFTYLCKRSNPPKEPIPAFIDTVRQHFRGLLRPPFNTEARLQAGMTEDWYMPLTVPPTAAPTDPLSTPPTATQ